MADAPKSLTWIGRTWTLLAEDSHRQFYEDRSRRWTLELGHDAGHDWTAELSESGGTLETSYCVSVERCKTRALALRDLERLVRAPMGRERR